MPSNSCEIRVGRLMEIDVPAGYNDVASVDQMIAMIHATLAKVPAERQVVIVADWRPCQVFTPAVAARALQMLIGSNPRVERSAILHRADQPTSVMQVFRLAKESLFDDRRRVFTHPRDIEGWLSEVLTPDELQRLRVFLGKRG